MPDWLVIALRTLLAVIILFFMTKSKGKVFQISLFEYITGLRSAALQLTFL